MGIPCLGARRGDAGSCASSCGGCLRRRVLREIGAGTSYGVYTHWHCRRFSEWNDGRDNSAFHKGGGCCR